MTTDGRTFPGPLDAVRVNAGGAEEVGEKPISRQGQSPSRARLEAVFAGEAPDRTPVLGGWIACPAHICALAEVSLDAYWADPVGVSIRAYEALRTDGLIDVFVPRSAHDFRCVDASSYVHAQGGQSLEEVIAQIDAMPDPESIEDAFDFNGEYAQFARDLRERQARCGDMVWMPAQWSAGGCVTWYQEFGYEAFFCIVAMYEARARKLIEIGGARGRCRSRLIARAVEEGLYPHAVLLGQDICSQRGPMISTAFLERHFAPTLRHGLEPLLDVGCKPVWHSDGDVRPMMDMLIDCGVQGFQGFQPECGMTLEYVIQKRTRHGEPLLIFGPLSVTTELPVCTPEQIRDKVRHAIDVCRGNAHLALFVANTINPDVPLENIRAMYEAART